jgi:hypothetical protein
MNEFIDDEGRKFFQSIIDKIEQKIAGNQAKAEDYDELAVNYICLTKDEKIRKEKAQLGIDYIRNEIANGRDSALLYMHLGSLFAYIKDKKMVKECYETAIGYGQDQIKIYSSWASSNCLILNYKKNKEILKILTSFVEGDPDNIELRNARANIYTDSWYKNEYTEEDYQKILELSTDENEKKYVQLELERFKEDEERFGKLRPERDSSKVWIELIVAIILVVIFWILVVNF